MALHIHANSSEASLRGIEMTIFNLKIRLKINLFIKQKLDFEFN